MTGAIKVEAVFPHPPERVWCALTEPDLLGAWLMANDFAPRVGHRFRFRIEPRPGLDGIVECEVTDVDPPRRLAFTWQGGPMPRPTLVTFALDPVAGGTRLRLRDGGVEGAAGLAVRALRGRGWRSLLRRQLPDLLTRLPADPPPAPAG